MLNDYGMEKFRTFEDAIRFHLNFWCQAYISDTDLNEMVVYIGSNVEITDMLEKGFDVPRIFVCVE